MANLQPMRYKDYVWPHNPRSYQITYRRAVAVHKVPYGHYTMENLGQSYRVMTGRGEFVGPQAYEEFKRLASVYYSGGAGILVHPWPIPLNSGKATAAMKQRCGKRRLPAGARAGARLRRRRGIRAGMLCAKAKPCGPSRAVTARP